MPSEISTHTPLAGRDRCLTYCFPQITHFNSHAPRGARRKFSCDRSWRKKFQLTRPSRGATFTSFFSFFCSHVISTHTPLAGRDGVLKQQYGTFEISTHTPLAGRDNRDHIDLLQHQTFQLTRPSRGATPAKSQIGRLHKISTHTPLAGRDAGEMAKRKCDFISTHTPLAGRDDDYISNELEISNFNSHAPRGARPLHLVCNSESFPAYRGADFSILKSARFYRFILHQMSLFQANLPGFLHHLTFPYHFIHAGIKKAK